MTGMQRMVKYMKGCGSSEIWIRYIEDEDVLRINFGFKDQGKKRILKIDLDPEYAGEKCHVDRELNLMADAFEEWDENRVY